jgi:hypothetical protein
VELITAAYKNDHLALLACATISRSFFPDGKTPDYALLRRNGSGGFSLVESVELADVDTGKGQTSSFWRSLADLLVSPSHPESPELDYATAQRLSDMGIGTEFRDSFVHEVPPDGVVILMLVEDAGVREKALAILRNFGGRERKVRLIKTREGT